MKKYHELKQSGGSPMANKLYLIYLNNISVYL